MKRIHPTVEEAVDTLGLPDVTRRRLLSGAGLASASLAATALLSACGRDADVPGVVGNFPETPRWRFTFVNHVTAHPFFTPTQYGLEDAAAILNVDTQWSGSADAIVAEMVDATNTAISGQVDGIALSVTDANAFTAPVDEALAEGIPVVSYNADGEPDNPGTRRLAYVGQPLYDSGRQLGQRLLDTGFTGGDVVCFIATPGSLNIQPRADGAKDVLAESGVSHTFTEIATGTDLADELNAIESYLLGNPEATGLLAVDGGSTDALGKIVDQLGLKAQGVIAGGFDLQPGSLESVAGGSLDYTIDQQPYLQGFLPVLQLYLFQLSGGLVVPCDTNTSLSFVTADNVAQFTEVESRYAGSASAQKLLERAGPIG